MFGGLGLMEIFIIFTPIILWVFALIDVLKSEFQGSNKLIWVLVIIFIPILGAILYLIIGRQQRNK